MLLSDRDLKAAITDGRLGIDPYDETLVELGEVLADLQGTRLDRAWKLPVLMRRRMQALRGFFRRRRSPEKG